MEEDTNDSVNMIEALQTRRTQRIAELQQVDDSPKGPVEIIKSEYKESPQHSIEEGSTGEQHSGSQSQASSILNLSIRERLRNRMKNAADRGSAPRKLRGLRDRTLPNRFEESGNIGTLAEELDPMLQQSIATTKQWKLLKLKKDKDAGIISEEEAFQFFVGCIDDVDGKSMPPEFSPDSEEIIQEIAESLFFMDRVKPAFPSYNEQLLSEAERYFYPSSIPALPEEKMRGGYPFRNLEEEGFYVGRTPSVKLGNLSRMENRIIAADADGSDWFDVDGHLKRLADPLKERSVQQMFTDDLDVDPLLELDWGKAQLSSFNTRYIDEQGKQHYQLDVDISMIRFLHHQLFTKEHFVESKLVQMYEQYAFRQKNGLCDHLKNKIHALHVRLKRSQMDNESSGKDSKRDQYDHQTDIYKEIREIQMNVENEEMKEQTLLMNILTTWKSLKKLREAQGFVNTATTLKVRKVLTNRVNDESEIREELEQRVNIERFFFHENHASQFQEYERNLLKWKKYQRSKKKELQASVQNQGIPREEIPAVPKPIPPPAFDEQEAWIKSREWMMKFKRKPGEPILIPELQSGAVITPTEKCPRVEQLRRADMKNARYMVKVLFNDLEVSHTMIKGMSTDFIVHFGDILNIKILQWPESIKLQIFNGTSMRMVAELYAPIPDTNVLSRSSHSSLTELEFSCAQIVQYNRHNAIGSGVAVYLDEDDGDPTIPLTNGFLYTSVSWGVDETGMSLAPSSSKAASAMSTSKQFDALAALGAEGMVDLQKVLTWICNAKLDPNDPVNADIITIAKMAQLSHFNNMSGPQFFRLKHLEEDMEFMTKEDMELNKRFKLIRLRSAGAFEFKHFQNIPIDEKFISDEIFEQHEKGQRTSTVGVDDVDQREAVASFLAKVRQQVHSRSELAKRQLDLEDFVTEEAIPDLGSLGARIAQIMEPRRPLKPTRKERKKIGGQGLASVKEVNILVNIIRAFNLPVRQFKSAVRPHEQSLAASFSTHEPRSAHLQTLLHPYIEVMFQGNILTTSVADGSFPNWNEDLILPFKAPNNDYTTDALQLITDSVYISLFDEVLIDVIQDDRLRKTTIHQRVEKRYLGSVEIPFSTIYFNSKVEGFIPLKSPAVLLGYQPCGDKINGLNMIKEVPLLQMFLTIDPHLQPAPAMPEIFETNEDENLVRYGLSWLTELRAKFDSRIYKVLVSDLDGKKVFISRYLHAQKPPDELLVDSDVPDLQKMKLLSRFVSLIPYIPDSVQFPDLCDIWTTSDQFLRMLAGDEEEHAILLCNYFLWLKKRAYIVLGYGIPEGSTAYVLMEDGVSFRVWNASTGRNYEIENVHCPLQNVGCVVAEDNIYANIQQDEHPSKISFNFSDGKRWKPFFNKSFPNPGISSIQVEHPPYLEIDTQYAINLQDDLDRLLRDKLMDWRPRTITKFHRGCTQAFKVLLESIESKTVLSDVSTTEHRRHLEQFVSSHYLTGYTLQMPFTGLEAVYNSVYSTGIHNIEEPGVEFAIASYVHPYPSGVLAIWVYIGSLVRKQR